jgi:hypothetical protein
MFLVEQYQCLITEILFYIVASITNYYFLDNFRRSDEINKRVSKAIADWGQNLNRRQPAPAPHRTRPITRSVPSVSHSQLQCTAPRGRPRAGGQGPACDSKTVAAWCSSHSQSPTLAASPRLASPHVERSRGQGAEDCALLSFPNQHSHSFFLHASPR